MKTALSKDLNSAGREEWVNVHNSCALKLISHFYCGNCNMYSNAPKL